MAIISIGIDLVEVDRIEAMLADHSDRFLERCFTSAEQIVGKGSRRYHEHLAVRFAAKEAAMKALGTGLADGISWTDCEIRKDAAGAPHLVLHHAALSRAQSLGATHWHVSLSHTETMAVATVILESRS